MHRTFQEYYTALYLLRQPYNELCDFVKAHYAHPIWREPLQLAIAAKSGENAQTAKKEASDLIRSIAAQDNEYAMMKFPKLSNTFCHARSPLSSNRY